MRTDSEAFRHYASDETHAGEPLPGGFDGAAGGAPCGDLVRISLALADGAIARVSCAAEGCATARAAAAATAALAEGLAPLEAARIGPDEIAAELGGLGPQGRHGAELAADALHRALSGLAGSGVALAAPAPGRERVLVALSGGVDSAVAALRERERGAEVVAVTLKLWSDRHTDAAASCCSPLAVLGARDLAHRLGIPHLTLDLEDRFRAGVVGAFVAGYRPGRTPNPCVICNGDLRIDAMLELADRVGAGALATGHYARVVDDGEGPLLSAAADPAKDQSYMLSGLRPASLARLRFPLAELRKTEVRAIAAAAGLPVAGQGREPGPLLSRRRGQARLSRAPRRARRSPRRDRRPHRQPPRRALGPPPLHRRPAPRTRARRRRGRCYVLATDADSQQGHRSARARSLRPSASAFARRRCIGRRARRPRSPALPLAPAGLRAARRAGAGAHDELELALAEPADGVAPGPDGVPADGDLVVGRATIA